MVEIEIKMSGLIKNDNCNGMCCESICSKPYTHYCNIFVGGMELHLPFYEEHCHEFYDYVMKGGGRR